METAACAHCGLGVRGPVRPGPAYCCAGCAVAAAVLAAARRPGSRDERALLLRLGLAAFFSGDVMVLTLFLYSGTAAPPAAMALIRVLLAAASVPVFVLLAPPFLAALARDARRLRLSTDGLIALGSAAAFLFSCAAVVRNQGEVYFETATMVLLLVTLGRLLEAHARVRGRRALMELLALQPPQARRMDPEGRTLVDASALRPGDRVAVLPGERIPADGRIVRGASAIDESVLTGESLPASRAEGETVHAGSLCLDGALEIDVEGDPANSLLARIVRLVEEAQRCRSPLEGMGDHVAAVLAPATLLLAAATLAWWWPRGPERALLNGLSVLVVACPCALGIALPVVNATALALAARRGILVRSAEVLERLARVDTVVFDKTGTVTAGRIEVGQLTAFAGSAREILAAAAGAAAGSCHPASRAVVAAAARAGVAFPAARRMQELPGRGVRAELADGRAVLLGQPRWIAAECGNAPAGPALLCAAEGVVVGGFDLRDPVSPAACETAAVLRHDGFDLHLLSGDRPEAVREAARTLGIAHAEGGLLPEEKAARVGELEAAGRRVAMVGDGINDAPALAAATVGIAVSGGTDVARETAQVVLIEPHLARVAEVLHLARLTRRMGFENLAWAVGYNGLALAAAAGGRLRPLWAAALMLASSVLVVSNSMRLPRRLGRRM